MCGRVVINLDSGTLVNIARARNMNHQGKYQQSFNIAPSCYIPSTYKRSDKTSENNLEAMKWGTKNKDEIPVINARSETVATYFKTWKRCAVIIQGYYEWKQNRTTSQPYYIHDKEKDYLLVAGIYKEIEKV